MVNSVVKATWYTVLGVMVAIAGIIFQTNRWKNTEEGYFNNALELIHGWLDEQLDIQAALNGNNGEGDHEANEEVNDEDKNKDDGEENENDDEDEKDV